MDSLYDPAVGAPVMSMNLAFTLIGEEPLVSTEKFLKLPSGELVECCDLAQNVSIVINKVHVLLNFYIFDVEDIDLLIGQPLMRFIDGFHSGHLKGQIGKNLNLSIPYVGSINAKIKLNPKTDPIEEVIVATHLEASHPNLEEEAKDYIEELETELYEPLELDESKPPPKPPSSTLGLAKSIYSSQVKGSNVLSMAIKLTCSQRTRNQRRNLVANSTEGTTKASQPKRPNRRRKPPSNQNIPKKEWRAKEIPARSPSLGPTRVSIE